MPQFELVCPASNRFIRHVVPTFGEQIFDISQTGTAKRMAVGRTDLPAEADEKAEESVQIFLPVAPHRPCGVMLDVTSPVLSKRWRLIGSAASRSG